MDSPNISIRIRRHESLPCPSLPKTQMHTSIAKVANAQSTNRTCGTASVLIGRRLGATKNNPYVGSFRHAPPTSLRSMAASSLPSLSSRKEIAASSSSSVSFSTSFAFAASSPYVGWFRHAPPVFSSFKTFGTASGMENGDNKTGNNHTRSTKPTRKSSVVQHKINLDSLLQVDRWHHQVTSLLLAANNEDTEKNPPLLLRQIINGRLLGGNREDGRRMGRSRCGDQNSIIHQCNSIYESNANRMPSLSGSETKSLTGYKNTVLSRLTSWLLFPLIYADDERFDDYGCLNDEYSKQKTTSGLKFLLSKSADDRSIEIDSDESDEDDDYSSTSSIDSGAIGESSIPYDISPETEREFSEEANLSVSEIAEAYYAQKVLDERRHRSNSDASQQSGLSSPSSLHPTTDYSREEETRQRLDYEITQMDIARMARNASRHLDVDSILKLPTVIYRKQPSTPTSCRGKQSNPQCERTNHHICTPISEDPGDSSTQDSLINVEDTDKNESILSEDGWSFMMVSDMKSSTVENSVHKYKSSFCSSHDTHSIDDMCVICQERFQDGDRLRVLPCNHSFHVGCIDRWLSGSHSHNECFTTGCPVCKKQPSMQSPSLSLEIPTLQGSETEDDDMSGSLPSWAFANLGNVLAMSSGDFPGDK